MEFLRRWLGLTTESENGLYSIRSKYNVPAHIGSPVLNKDGNIGKITLGLKKANGNTRSKLNLEELYHFTIQLI